MSGQFDVRLEFAPGWTFRTTFPRLPPSRIAVDGSVKLSPSFLTDLALVAPALVGSAVPGATPQVRLTGTLPLASALGPYADYFGLPQPLDGLVTLPATANEPPDSSSSPILGRSR